MTLKPEVNREAARTQLTRQVIPDHHAARILKKKAVKVQAITSSQANINSAQQWHWHKLIDQVYDELQDINLGKCKMSGKTFGEVFEHFVIGLDEMCIMSDGHNMMVIGSRDKAKHEF
jgi:hypothetical protein